MNLITLSQAAQIANRDTSTLRRAIQRGNLFAQKFGKTWLVDRPELDRWINDPDAHIPGVKKKPK